MKRRSVMRRPFLQTILRFACLLLVAAVPATLFAQSTPSGWTPELAMKVKGIGTVRVSPDGRKVAYTVSDAVMTPDKSEYVTQIWLVNNDGSDAMQLTFA